MADETVKMETFYGDFGNLPRYRCSVRDYGQGIYLFMLSDPVGSINYEPHLSLPYALAQWLERNPEISIVSMIWAQEDQLLPKLLIATKRST